MKKIIFILSLLVFIACKKESEESFGRSETKSQGTQTDEELGKEIFIGKGNCVACHKTAVKLVGPSVQDIAKIYKDKKGNIISFLKDDAKPIVDPSQYEVMKTSFPITEEMSDKELEALQAYIYSNAK